jgi:hypothetical protein
MNGAGWKRKAWGLGLGLCLALRLPAAAFCWEDWQGLQPRDGGVLAWGDTHLVQVDERGTPRTLTAAGTLAGAAGDREGGVWAVFRDGRWRRWQGDGWRDSWQVADSTTALAVYHDERETFVWQAAPGRIHRITLEAQPRLEQSLELPGPPAGELRVDHDGRLFVRQQWVVYGETSGRLVEVGRLPADTRCWAVSGGALWALRDGGRLWTPGSGHPAILPGIPQAWPIQGGLVLRTEYGQLWILHDGLIQVLPDLPDFPLDPGGTEARILPGSAGWLAVETATERHLLKLAGQAWQERTRMVRPPALVDRWIAGARQWRLCRDGRLLLDHQGQSTELATVSHPVGMYHAGAGPLVLGRDELAAWSREGELLHRQPMAQALGAAAREDHLVIGLTGHLLVMDTIEEQPQIAADLGLRIPGELLLGERWGVIRLGRRLELLDLDPPWLPRSLDLGLAPRAEGEGLILEDHLLLASPERLEVLELGESGIRPLDEPCVRYPVAHFCRRGPDRLLTLDPQGILRQLRLVNNLPVSVEWEGELPLVGRMRIQGDSLRVLGHGAALDWPLPVITRIAAPSAPAGPRIRPEAEPRMAGHRWIIERPIGLEGELVADLVDLRGARCGRWTLPDGQAELVIDGRRLARGLYFLQLQSPRGEGRVVRINMARML